MLGPYHHSSYILPDLTPPACPRSYCGSVTCSESNFSEKPCQNEARGLGRGLRDFGSEHVAASPLRRRGLRGRLTLHPVDHRLLDRGRHRRWWVARSSLLGRPRSRFLSRTAAQKSLGLFDLQPRHSATDHEFRAASSLRASLNHSLGRSALLPIYGRRRPGCGRRSHTGLVSRI